MYEYSEVYFSGESAVKVRNILGQDAWLPNIASTPLSRRDVLRKAGLDGWTMCGCIPDTSTDIPNSYTLVFMREERGVVKA